MNERMRKMGVDTMALIVIVGLGVLGIILAPVVFKKEEIKLTAAKAYELIQKEIRKSDKYPWHLLSTSIEYEGENNYYLVGIKDYNFVEKEDESAFVLFHYEDDEWKYDLPGTGGVSEEYLEEYGLVKVAKTKYYYSLDDQLAEDLFNCRIQGVGYPWTASDVKVIAKSKQGYTLVQYTEHNGENTREGLKVIFKEENGIWLFNLPGEEYTEESLESFEFKYIK